MDRRFSHYSLLLNAIRHYLDNCNCAIAIVGNDLHIMLCALIIDQCIIIARSKRQSAVHIVSQLLRILVDHLLAESLTLGFCIYRLINLCDIRGVGVLLLACDCINHNKTLTRFRYIDHIAIVGHHNIARQYVGLLVVLQAHTLNQTIIAVSSARNNSVCLGNLRLCIVAHTLEYTIDSCFGIEIIEDNLSCFLIVSRNTLQTRNGIVAQERINIAIFAQTEVLAHLLLLILEHILSVVLLLRGFESCAIVERLLNLYLLLRNIGILSALLLANSHTLLALERTYILEHCDLLILGYIGITQNTANNNCSILALRCGYIGFNLLPSIEIAKGIDRVNVCVLHCSVSLVLLYGVADCLSRRQCPAHQTNTQEGVDRIIEIEHARFGISIKRLVAYDKSIKDASCKFLVKLIDSAIPIRQLLEFLDHLRKIARRHLLNKLRNCTRSDLCHAFIYQLGNGCECIACHIECRSEIITQHLREVLDSCCCKCLTERSSRIFGSLIPARKYCVSCFVGVKCYASRHTIQCVCCGTNRACGRSHRCCTRDISCYTSTSA